MCVCVCEREKEGREQGGGNWYLTQSDSRKLIRSFGRARRSVGRVSVLLLIKSPIERSSLPLLHLHSSLSLSLSLPP